MQDNTVAKHSQIVSHTYKITFPEHSPRSEDPHYAAFETFKRKMKNTPDWVCAYGKRFNDFSHCANDKPLEIHHKIIEFAIQNEVDLHTLQIDFPEVQTQEELDRFVESDQNFEILCQFHHRGHGGKHTASYADYEASLFVDSLIT